MYLHVINPIKMIMERCNGEDNMDNKLCAQALDKFNRVRIQWTELSPS
jgi:hypothetical protein